MKKIRYILEAALLYTLLGFFKLLPVETASNIGGAIGRFTGPKLAASRKAMNNIDAAFPGKSAAEKKEILAEMWENLGRVMAEYPHLETIGRNRVTFLDKHILEKAVADGRGGVFVGAHQGNWEVSIPALLLQYGIAANLTYRAPNNPMSDRLLEKFRTLGGRVNAIPKARASARDLTGALKSKEFIGILIDQKYNEGIAVDFFGRPAMTNPVAVTLAQRYKCPLIAISNRRTGPARFEVTLHEPTALHDPSGVPLPAAQILQELTAGIESSVRGEPGQWLWLHRRWAAQNAP